MSKKILVFYHDIAPYRIDVHNSLSEVYEFKAVLTGKRDKLSDLGYDLETVNKQADFSYQYYSGGFYFGRHLVSSVYRKTIKSFRPDIVFAHELGLNTLIAIFLKPFYKYKLFITIDDSPVIAKNYSSVRKLLRRFVIPRVNGIFVVHPEVGDFLSRIFKNCHYFFLPLIQSDKLLEEKFRDALPLSQNIFEHSDFKGKKVILFVGRLVQIKAPDLLLKVFTAIYNSNNNLRLVFIGEGPMETVLKEYVIQHHLQDIVHFTGRLTGNELYAWYNIGQVLVLPSYSERFGAVVNEGLAAGCKAVVSDSIGATSLISNNNGMIFKTNDFESLANALQQTLQDISPLEKIQLRNSNMSVSFPDVIGELISFIES